MRLGSRPCDCRCGVTIQRHRRPGSLLHPEPFRAPDLDLSLHPTLPGDDHSGIMLTVKYLRLRRQGEWTFRSAYPFLRIRICVTLNLYPPMCPFLVIRTRKLTKTHPACLFLQIRTCGVVLRVCVCLFLPNRTHRHQNEALLCPNHQKRTQERLADRNNRNTHAISRKPSIARNLRNPREIS